MTTNLFRNFLTAAGVDFPLTGSYVASEQFPLSGLPHQSISIVYDPDEADGVLEVQVEVSDDPMEVTAANSSWRTLGVAARATAIVTYTPDTSLKLTSTGAATKKYLTATYRDEPGQKIRIQAKETFTGGGSNLGNARIVGYSYNG